jgi:hypothetical protein
LRFPEKLSASHSLFPFFTAPEFVDGPEFDGHKVDFDNLTARNKRYIPEEQIALRRFQEAK